MGRNALSRARSTAHKSLKVGLVVTMLVAFMAPTMATAAPLPGPDPIPISHAYTAFDSSGMEAFDLGGSATVEGGAVRLTPASSDQIGTMFTKAPLRIRNSGEFSTCFSFRIDGSNPTTGGAEGLTFVMSSDKDSLVPAGLGFTGGGSTMRVEFDTHKDPWDINDNHISFWVGGDETNHDPLIVQTPTFDLDDGGIKYCWIDYQDGGFRIAFSDTPTRVAHATSCGMSAGYMGAYGTTEADVYFGFTGVTATEYATHEIVSWHLDNEYHPTWIAPLDPAVRTYATGPAALEVATDPDRIDTGASTEVTFTVTNAYGAPLANHSVAVSASAGTLSAPTVTSDVNGLATVVLTAPSTKQICTVTGETPGGLRAIGSLLVGDDRPVVAVPEGTISVPRGSDRVVTGVEITDSDDTTLTAARARILSSESSSEWLGLPTPDAGITRSYSLDYQVNLEGAASLADYERILGSVYYHGSPSVGVRQVEYSVFDGLAWSAPVVKNIEIGPMEPFAGDDRYETAIITSQESFPEGSNTVVIATGEDWPDALGGSALAGLTYGPVLLSPKDAMPADVLAEVERLDASSAYVLGGENALSDDVLAALTDHFGEEDVTRLGGADRYETAEIIAAEVADIMSDEEMESSRAFIATGENFADALAAAPLAAGNCYPIYLSGPHGISDSTAQAMLDANITEAILLGGEAAVTPDTEVTVLGIGIDAYRIDGADRYETATKIAAYGHDELGMNWDGVAIATGENFADALSGGVAQGGAWTVMLLSDPDSLSPAARDALEANASSIRGIRFLGGTSALSQTVRDQAMDAIAP